MTAWFPRLRLVAPVSVIHFAGICCRCGRRYGHLPVRVVRLCSRVPQEELRFFQWTRRYIPRRHSIIWAGFLKWVLKKSGVTLLPLNQLIIIENELCARYTQAYAQGICEVCARYARPWGNHIFHNVWEIWVSWKKVYTNGIRGYLMLGYFLYEIWYLCWRM